MSPRKAFEAFAGTLPVKAIAGTRVFRFTRATGLSA
jgi:hypothetical protein